MFHVGLWVLVLIIAFKTSGKEFESVNARCFLVAVSLL